MESVVYITGGVLGLKLIYPLTYYMLYNLVSFINLIIGGYLDNRSYLFAGRPE